MSRFQSFSSLFFCKSPPDASAFQGSLVASCTACSNLFKRGMSSLLNHSSRLTGELSSSARVSWASLIFSSNSCAARWSFSRSIEDIFLQISSAFLAAFWPASRVYVLWNDDRLELPEPSASHSFSSKFRMLSSPRASSRYFLSSTVNVVSVLLNIQLPLSLFSLCCFSS